MKKILFVLFIVLSGCSKDKLDNDKLILNGSWIVVSFEDHVANTAEYKNEENSWGFDITVTFDDSSRPHMISGINLTNSFSGEYRYKSEKQFEIQDFKITEKGAPDWGHKFLEAIRGSQNEFVVNQDQLRIYYSDKKKSVLLERQ